MVRCFFMPGWPDYEPFNSIPYGSGQQCALRLLDDVLQAFLLSYLGGGAGSGPYVGNPMSLRVISIRSGGGQAK